MNAPRIGSLFSGYGGLDTAVADVFGGSLAWYADVCKFDKAGNAGHHEPHRAPCSIMAHHHPDVPNVGDVTGVDWSAVEPVDILTGGSPCQDLSHAGKRAGMTEGTRSNLWVAMREAIAQLRPRIVVWENVRGAYSAGADSDLESDARLLAGVRRRDGEPVLRALGRVLGDLSDLGYDCRWHGLRAADVGAPHGRFRVFVVAADARSSRLGQHAGGTPPQEAWSHEGHQPDGHGAGPHAPLTLLPTPSCSDTNGAGQHGDGGLDLRTAVNLLPTPTTRDHKDHTIRREPHRPDDVDTLARALTDVPCALLPTPAVEAWDEWTAKMQAADGNGNGHGKSLAIEAQRLLPTPTVGDAKSARNSTATRHKMPPTGVHAGDTLTDAVVPLLPTPRVTQAGYADDGRGGRSLDVEARLLPTPTTEPLTGNGHARHLGGEIKPERWGDYAAAIARWEQVLGRPAPAPTQTSAKGNPQLSAKFVEWLMGLPAGWVTDVPGITRNEALKALGNGVVPQQAAAALRVMLAWEAAA